MNQLQFIFSLIIVVVGICIGMAFLNPIHSVIASASADMNCSTASASPTKFTCTIMTLYLDWFVIGIFLCISGLLAYGYVRRQQPEEYYPQEYQQEQYYNSELNNGDFSY